MVSKLKSVGASDPQPNPGGSEKRASSQDKMHMYVWVVLNFRNALKGNEVGLFYEKVCLWFFFLYFLGG